jgi:hypothetical protein
LSVPVDTNVLAVKPLPAAPKLEVIVREQASDVAFKDIPPVRERISSSTLRNLAY